MKQRMYFLLFVINVCLFKYTLLVGQTRQIKQIVETDMAHDWFKIIWAQESKNISQDSHKNNVTKSALNSVKPANIC